MYEDEGRSSDYWDSNIWVAYLLRDRDIHYPSCRPLFDDLHDGKRTVDVSDLVIGEVVHVIRREAARTAVQECGGGVPRPRAAQDIGDEGVAVFFHKLGGLFDRGRVTIRPPSDNARWYASMSMRMVIKHKGHFEPHGKMGLIYKALGMVDIMHALAARDYNVKNFCTRDRQFGALAGDPAFTTLNFDIF